MRRRVKLLSILIAGAMLLSGCGAVQRETKPSGDNPASSQQPEASDAIVSDILDAHAKAEEITLELTLNEKLELMVSGYEDITKMVRFFPGEDHLEKATVEGELPVRHDSLMSLRDTISELYPELPSGGKDRIMMNYTCYPKISAELEPAFMSYTIVTSILREELGFNGVIYTPSLCDSQLRSRYIVDADAHLAVDAVKAGCDVVYQPHNRKVVIEALRSEVFDGGIDEDRINASSVRIIEYKLLTGVDEDKIVNVIK